MTRPLILLALLLGNCSASARESNEQYRKLLDIIAYHGITIGDPRSHAMNEQEGFAQFFLMNACFRTKLDAPFDPDTELMFIYSPHGGRILGVRYTIRTKTPAAIAAVEAIKARIEAIYKITLTLGGKAVEKDDITMGWTTRDGEGQDHSLELSVYDWKLHDELQALDRPAQ